uniref:Uncharacterized protein n=1 Tax=Cacopsylla melanoneura TaxID=428564 RepID=A0A8D8VIV0_9HEMI
MKQRGGKKTYTLAKYFPYYRIRKVKSYGHTILSPYLWTGVKKKVDFYQIKRTIFLGFLFKLIMPRLILPKLCWFLFNFPTNKTPTWTHLLGYSNIIINC